MNSAHKFPFDLKSGEEFGFELVLPLMALTYLWFALADQSSPVEILANSVDKRRSDDEPEHCLQVTSLANFLFFHQTLYDLFLNYFNHFIAY